MQQYRKNLGKVSLTAEGAWNLNNSYDILSIVYDEHTQHGFISRKAVPQGVDLYNKEYWMPLNVSGYADNNIIILSKKTSEASIQSYTLEEAITSIKSVGRRPGAILGFYNENNDRLDIGGRWELWQFNDTNIYNWENVDSWQNLYYNYNKFMGWFKDENFLNKYAPFPEIGCYAFVGSEFNEATVYRCDNKYVWNNTTQHAWDYIKVIVDGNVTVGKNGNWFNNGEDTGIPASVKGENGKTPIIRNNDNVLEVSYDNVNWEPISDEIAVWLRVNNNKLEMTKNKSGGWEVVSDYISAWFRWQSDGGEQITSVGKIQITRDGVSWTDLSGNFVNHLRISKYIGAGESLPTSGIAEGTIYAKGPTYDTSDTSHSNPIYRLWVYAWKDNTLAWQDNGEFTSIAAGVVQETGNSETEVMSQKATTQKFSELDSKIGDYEVLSYNQLVGGYIDSAGNIVNETVEVYNYYVYDLTGIMGVISGYANTTNKVIGSCVYIVDGVKKYVGKLTTVNKYFEFISEGVGTLYVSSMVTVEAPIVYKSKEDVVLDIVKKFDSVSYKTIYNFGLIGTTAIGERLYFESHKFDIKDNILRFAIFSDTNIDNVLLYQGNETNTTLEYSKIPIGKYAEISINKDAIFAYIVASGFENSGARFTISKIDAFGFKRDFYTDIETLKNLIQNNSNKVNNIGDVVSKSIVINELSYVDSQDGWVQPGGGVVNNSDTAFFKWFKYDISGTKGIISGQSPVKNSIVVSYSLKVNGEIVQCGELTTIRNGFSIYIEDTYDNAELYVSGATQSYIPTVCVISGLAINGIIENTVNINKIKENNTSSNNSFWKNKYITWFGTSIPNGNSPILPEGTSVGDSYPIYCGELLSAAKVYNEAIGESAANNAHEDSRYSVHIRRMGATIKELLEVINDTWIIDDVNRSFSVGKRTLGLTNIPQVNSYSDVIWQRWFAISNSYQIRLVSRHLLSNEEHRISYLKNNIGNELYNIILSQYPALLNYKETDLFVFDHCHNDMTANTSYDINSNDRTTFFGAMNTFVNEIYKYAPHKTIVLLTDYINTGNSKAVVALAENLNLPCIKVYDLVPFNNNNVKFYVKGYWNKNTSTWVNEGFEWNDNTGVPDDMFLNIYQKGDSISKIKDNIKPYLDSEGVWWYKSSKLSIRIKDAVHPHTDASQQANNIYAKVLAKKLEEYAG